MVKIEDIVRLIDAVPISAHLKRLQSQTHTIGATDTKRVRWYDDFGTRLIAYRVDFAVDENKTAILDHRFRECLLEHRDYFWRAV